MSQQWTVVVEQENKMTDLPNLPKVLIVDDDPNSLYTMEMLLSAEPYELDFADSGQMALAKVEAMEPDILLLDIILPDMDGHEVCQRLRAKESGQHIPIILATALNRREDIVRGLEAGADDFLTKPVNGAELRARVRSMLRIKKQYDEIQAALQLREDMADMIVHDMRSPLSTLILYTDLLALPDVSSEKKERYTSTIRTQAQRLNGFLADLLILAKMDSGKLLMNREPLDVRDLVLDTLDQYKDITASMGICLSTVFPENIQESCVDKKLMQRVIDNLVVNAIKFSSPDSQITVQIEYLAMTAEIQRPALSVRIRVIDEGSGIPKEYHERIFDKYEIVASKNCDIQQVGLGLALCKLVVDAHGGRIFVESNEPHGAIFTIEI